MACIVYQKHKNGSTYAYRSESSRDPRTGRPTSRREYIGRVDPDTGAIVPKRSRKRRAAPAAADPGASEARIAVLEAENERLEAENARLVAALREAMGHVGDAWTVMEGALDGEEEGERGGPGGGA